MIIRGNNKHQKMVDALGETQNTWDTGDTRRDKVDTGLAGLIRL